MVWCTMWIFNPPVGIRSDPMLLVLANGDAVSAADGFTAPVLFPCLAAFLFAAIIRRQGSTAASRSRC